jgi:hypothetical protein
MIGDGLTSGVPGTLSAVSTFFNNTSHYYEVLPKSSRNVSENKVGRLKVLITPSPWEHTQQSEYCCHSWKLSWESYIWPGYSLQCQIFTPSTCFLSWGGGRSHGGLNQVSKRGV